MPVVPTRSQRAGLGRVLHGQSAQGGGLAAEQGGRADPGRALRPDIRSWVLLMGRMAGWHPSKRRSLPGNEVLWRAYVQLQGMVRYRQAARAP